MIVVMMMVVIMMTSKFVLYVSRYARIDHL